MTTVVAGPRYKSSMGRLLDIFFHGKELVVFYWLKKISNPSWANTFMKDNKNELLEKWNEKHVSKCGPKVVTGFDRQKIVAMPKW